jgi:hypothetical protein
MDKLSAESRLRDTVRLVQFRQLEVDGAEKRLRSAERRVGETRAHLRASGLLARTSLDNPN